MSPHKLLTNVGVDQCLVTKLTARREHFQYGDHTDFADLLKGTCSIKLIFFKLEKKVKVEMKMA